MVSKSAYTTFPSVRHLPDPDLDGQRVQGQAPPGLGARAGGPPAHRCRFRRLVVVNVHTDPALTSAQLKLHRRTAVADGVGHLLADREDDRVDPRRQAPQREVDQAGTCPASRVAPPTLT